MAAAPPKLTGVSTEVWGPKAWGFLHAVGFAYPAEPTPLQREAAYRLLLSLGELLPCTRCRRHYAEMLQDPATGMASSGSEHLASGERLSRWLVELHNRVNQRLGKPRVAYEEVAPLYSGSYVCPAEPPTGRGLLADLCGGPEATLERGLPAPLGGCFAGFPGGNTGAAMAMVAAALLLVAIGVALAARSRGELLRRLERELPRRG